MRTPDIYELTQAELMRLLYYDPDTGIFRWKGSRWCKAGDIAGWVDSQTKYYFITIAGKRYLAHRLAWLYVNGHLPVDEIDHRNQVRSDNRISNLRPANSFGNKCNAGKRATNTSGYKGVSFNRVHFPLCVMLIPQNPRDYGG